MRSEHDYAARCQRLAERCRRALQIQDLEGLIRSYFGPGATETAVHSAWVLSGMDPDAMHLLEYGRYGLFQLTPLEAGLDPNDWELLLSPICAVAAAWALVALKGWARFPPCPILPPTQHPEDLED